MEKLRDNDNVRIGRQSLIYTLRDCHGVRTRWSRRFGFLGPPCLLLASMYYLMLSKTEGGKSTRSDAMTMIPPT